MTFIEKLQLELEPGIQEILNHPFIMRLNTADLSRDELRFFAQQYHIYNSYFPRLLSAVAANIVDDKTRMPIIENLWEEHGSGKIDQSHRILYERFAGAVGLTLDELSEVEPLSTTSICCEHLLQTCLDDDFVTSLGVLGPGTEYFTNSEYIKILEGLSKYDFFSEDDLYFWKVHISLDEDHYAEMLEAIRPYCNNAEGRHKVKVGARKAIDLEILFWDGLEDALNKSRNNG